MGTITSIRRPRRLQAAVWFAVAVLCGCISIALCISLIGILPGLGFGAFTVISIVYGRASLQGEPLRGALGRARLRNGPDFKRETDHAA